MAASVDRIDARIADLVGAGLKYLVLGPARTIRSRSTCSPSA